MSSFSFSNSFLPLCALYVCISICDCTPECKETYSSAWFLAMIHSRQPRTQPVSPVGFVPSHQEPGYEAIPSVALAAMVCSQKHTCSIKPSLSLTWVPQLLKFATSLVSWTWQGSGLVSSGHETRSGPWDNNSPIHDRVATSGFHGWCYLSSIYYCVCVCSHIFLPLSC